MLRGRGVDACDAGDGCCGDDVADEGDGGGDFEGFFGWVGVGEAGGEVGCEGGFEGEDKCAEEDVETEGEEDGGEEHFPAD